MRITYLEQAWLNSRGGRTENDVLKDELGYYVLMGSGKLGVDMKVYIPKKNVIAKMFAKQNYENNRKNN